MSTSELIVRPIELSDIPEIWKIIKDHADSEEVFLARVKQKQLFNDHFIPVAVYRGQVAGYAWVHDYGEHLRSGHKTARLNDLFVLKELRKLGIGRELFFAVRDWSKQQGVRWLQWQASTRAIGFYEQLGLKGDPCPDPEHPFFEIEFTKK
jgi:GNAT superfamily N-acetyltransferase